MCSNSRRGRRRHRHHTSRCGRCKTHHCIGLMHGFLLQYAEIIYIFQKGFMRWEYFDAIEIFFQLFNITLLLCTTILEPGYHLCVWETQGGGDFIAIGWWQVLLIEKTFFQFEYLMIGECGAWLALFLRLWAVGEDIQVGFIWKKKPENKIINFC